MEGIKERIQILMALLPTNLPIWSRAREREKLSPIALYLEHERVLGNEHYFFLRSPEFC